MAEKYPFKISYGENKAMQAYDMQLQVGGFATADDADAFARRIAEFMESEAGATFERVQ